MATRFEIVLPGDDEVRLRAIAEEAFDEVDRIEALLSAFRPTSEIAHLNTYAAYEPVRVSRETFHLLRHAAQLSAETGGAFDITVGPLMRAWGFFKGDGHLPDPEQLATARACVGMNLVQLDEARGTVRFALPGAQLDLGAIGKGYAVGRAADLLRDMGITSALIHGGTSTIYAIGHPPNSPVWNIAVEDSRGTKNNFSVPITRMALCDEALSMSAGWGKSFQANGRSYGHVFDVHIGKPAQNALSAVVVAKCAAETDALSTALLTLGSAGKHFITGLRPSLRAIVLTDRDKSD